MLRASPDESGKSCHSERRAGRTAPVQLGAARHPRRARVHERGVRNFHAHALRDVVLELARHHRITAGYRCAARPN